MVVGEKMIPVSSPDITSADAEAVRKVVADGYISGRASPVRQFEKEFSEALFDSKRSVYAVANGTVALQLALESIPLKKGEPVVVPALTYSACANAILDAGGIPVFTDLDPNDSWCSGPKEMKEAALRSGSRIMMLVHLYGEPVRMTNLHNSSQTIIIEDCAEALGSFYHWDDWENPKAPEYCGSKPYTISCFSFYANKLFSTGEGGAVSCQRRFGCNAKEDKILRLCNNGTKDAGDYYPIISAHNMRMSALQAALGTSQLQRMDATIMMRQAVMDLYTNQLDGVIKTTNKERCPRPWMFSIHVPGVQREAEKFLKSEYEIETRRPFSVLPTCSPYMKYSGGKDFPVAEERSKSWLFIPSSPILSTKDQKRVIEGIRAFVKAGGD